MRNPPLLSQRKLNLLSLAILFVVSSLQIRNASKEVSSLDNGYNGNSIAKKAISAPPICIPYKIIPWLTTTLTLCISG